VTYSLPTMFQVSQNYT